MPSSVIDWPSFASGLAAHFGIADEIRPESLLIDDLGFDSLDIYELVVFLDEVAAHDVPDELVETLATAGDVFAYYAQFSAVQG